MTDFSASDWNELPSGNVNASPNGVQGSYAPSQVAPIIREIRAASKRAWVRNNPVYTTTGTGSAFALTFIQGPVSYVRGERFAVWAHADNTGPATININTLGAKQLLSQHGTPLVAGAITAGSVIEFVFDGTSFILISNEKSKATVQSSLTVNAGANSSPTLALSPNNVIRAALSSSANGGIAVTLSNANSAFVRSLVVPETGSATLGGDIIWTSGNMGANSALNSDLLDGQHGAWYQDLTNSTGTLPNARLSGDYSFTNLTLSGRLNVTGDRVEVSVPTGTNPEMRLTRNAVRVASLYQDSTGLVLRNFNASTGTGEGYIRISGNGASDLTYNGNIIWHAGNMGANSTLDAGLLAGQNSAYYRNLANSTGTLPNARISGAYDGITNLSMTGALGITSSAPTINFIDTTSGSYNTRLMVDANNWYLQKQADGATSWTTFAQFEMDTTNAYLNGSQIMTAANHGHVNLGTTAATARSALGLGDYATLDRSAFYTVGGVGTYALLNARSGGSVSPGTTRAGSALEYAAASGSLSGTSPGGTWRCMGFVSDSGSGTGSTSLWLRIS